MNNKKPMNLLPKLDSFLRRKREHSYFIEDVKIYKNIRADSKERLLSINVFKTTKMADLIDEDQPGTASEAATEGELRNLKEPLVPPIGKIGNKLDLRNFTRTYTITMRSGGAGRSKLAKEMREKYGKLIPGAAIDNSETICVQICKDQDGSRYVQRQMEERWNGAEMDEFFDLVSGYVRELSTNLFGNYVIQKMVALLDESQLERMRAILSGHVLELSTNMFGCRVIQGLVERLKKKEGLLDEVVGCTGALMVNPFGNHVLKKCIDVEMEAERQEFISGFIRALVAGAREYAMEKHGCRMVQHALAVLPEKETREFAYVLLSNAQELAKDQYGNYVVQVLIRNKEYSKILEKYVVENSRELSLCKYSSNIVEKYCSSGRLTDDFFDEFNVPGPDGRPFMLTMIKDGCANYVVQSLYNKADSRQRTAILHILEEYKDELATLPYYKTLCNKFEK
ncbi:PUM2 [Enterospora canceri]|uniref:PUM2 n=1 Tax=Enterospora canceri TaxID=1081671 RepID=A0A1Y1S5C7_9MICR|nr:PUM2 [Enterospora canceri]